MGFVFSRKCHTIKRSYYLAGDSVVSHAQVTSHIYDIIVVTLEQMKSAHVSKMYVIAWLTVLFRINSTSNACTTQVLLQASSFTSAIIPGI